MNADAETAALVERESVSSSRLPGLIACLTFFLICLFLPAHNVSAQTNVMITVSTTTIVQGSSATVTHVSDEGASDSFTLEVTPSTAPFRTQSGNDIGNGYRVSPILSAQPRHVIITAYKDNNIPMGIRTDPDVQVEPLNGKNTEIQARFTGTNINFIYQGRNRGAAFTVPLVICAAGSVQPCRPPDPEAIRLKLRVFLEGALR